jgi:hypothetical protein
MVEPINPAVPTPDSAAKPAVTTQDGTVIGNQNESDLEDTTLLGAETKKVEGDPKPATDGKDVPKEEGSKEVPEKYEIKIPEGLEFDQAALDLFTPIFKELGISEEGAQKLVDAYVPTLEGMEQRMREQSLKQYKEIVEGWKKETLAELGTDSSKKLALCAKAINKYGGDNLRAALDQTGMGNHPEFVKFMLRVGETITEDAFIDPKNPLPGQTSEAKLKAMYPTMKDI